MDECVGQGMTASCCTFKDGRVDFHRIEAYALARFRKFTCVLTGVSAAQHGSKQAPLRGLQRSKAVVGEPLCGAVQEGCAAASLCRASPHTGELCRWRRARTGTLLRDPMFADIKQKAQVSRGRVTASQSLEFDVGAENYGSFQAVHVGI